MPAPLVSVVMTVRNRAAYLKRAVDSILTQTLSNFELVLVDDGSTDDTAGVVAACGASDRRVRAFHRPPEGISGATNFGIAQARTEYIARLDSDDMALPDRLEKQVAYLDEHPEIAVVGGSMIIIDTRDRKLRHVVYPTGTPDTLRDIVERGPALAHPAVTMRKSVVDALGGYRREFDSAEDYDLWLRVSERSGLANLPDVVVYYRTHGQQVTTMHHKRQSKLTELARALSRRRRAGQSDPIDEGLGLDAAMRTASLTFDDAEKAPVSPEGAKSSI